MVETLLGLAILVWGAKNTLNLVMAVRRGPRLEGSKTEGTQETRPRAGSKAGRVLDGDRLFVQQQARI